MAKTLLGKVVSITATGDAVTDIRVESLADIDDWSEIRLSCAEHLTIGVFPEDHQQPAMTFVAIAGADGHIQLRLVGDSLSEFLGIDSGDEVKLQW